MSSQEIIFKALFKRLISNVNEIIKNTPDLIRKEWELFQEEVEAEINRSDSKEKPNKNEEYMTEEADINEDIVEKVDRIRAQISDLSNEIEDELK